MARSNFGFDKRQKELKRKKKSEEKRQRMQERRNAAVDANQPPPTDTPLEPESDKPEPT
jgi:hypothetical protein